MEGERGRERKKRPTSGSGARARCHFICLKLCDASGAIPPRLSGALVEIPNGDISRRLSTSSRSDHLHVLFCSVFVGFFLSQSPLLPLCRYTSCYRRPLLVFSRPHLPSFRTSLCVRQGKTKKNKK